ncbi:ABC transporter permease [Alkalihalobacillus sp. MEB130]|uniref:ABC transporter permease n=1 Tax=Alkalihalobacillus sp. MEB130 TaxID=2976704 RepID=UPI0028DF1A83|nr:ABC transporter permease [Alkalihalobacillus sp. MEB130]MDT8860740.1 ABC transporter permease [Alkalihalobacillus sp. MEB130]
METVTEKRNETQLKRMKSKVDLADLGPVLALLILIIIGSILSPVFLTKGNLLNILTQISVLGLGAIGMTYVVIGRFFDLSVAGMLSLSAVLIVGFQPFLGTIGAIFAVILVALVVGLINGSILRFIKGDFGASIMITFGTGTILASLALLYTGGFTLNPERDTVFTWFGNGSFLGIPAPIVTLIFFSIILHVVLKYTTFGRAIYLTGANHEAARLSGIPIHRIRTITFMIVAVLVSIGGLIRSSQTLNASPVVGVGFELDVIAAVAIGGTSLAGGAGNISRTLVGVLIIGVLNNVFVLMGLSNYDQMMAKGLIIVAALLLDRRKELKLVRKG